MEEYDEGRPATTQTGPAQHLSPEDTDTDLGSWLAEVTARRVADHERRKAARKASRAELDRRRAAGLHARHAAKLRRGQP